MESTQRKSPPLSHGKLSQSFAGRGRRLLAAVFPQARFGVAKAQTPMYSRQRKASLRRMLREPTRCAHQELYHTADTPITRFGYANDFEKLYELGERIGGGSFGSVYIAVEHATGQRFAVKRMTKRFGGDGFLDKYYVRRVRNEVDIGNHLGPSLNVAYLYGAFENETSVDLVMELCTGGELWDKIKARGIHYSERDAARLIRELLRTVAQCHSAGVLMRDIKVC